MALREFTDGSGRQWRAWDIQPHELPNATRVEDYLNTMLGGWLVFESSDGVERRRVFPLPRDWSAMSDVELRHLWEAAAPVPEARRSATAAEDSRDRSAGD